MTPFSSPLTALTFTGQSRGRWGWRTRWTNHPRRTWWPV